jgi:hypothetical protein
MTVLAPDGRTIPGLLRMRPAPAGMPDPNVVPPTFAESGDPFALLRIVDIVARLERGRPIRIEDVVDALNARHLDWLFTRPVVVDALVALQANWMADYRNMAGFELGESDYGPTVFLEDSSRVDPWIVGQARRAAAACQESLREFAQRDRATADG